MENKLTKFLSKKLAQKGKSIAVQVKKLYAKATKDAVEDEAEKLLEELGLFDWTDLIATVSDSLQDIAMETNGDVLAELDVSSKDLLDLVNERAEEFARQRAAELVGKKYNSYGELVDNIDAEWAITDSTREMLRETIAQAFEDGVSPQVLADKIMASYAFSAKRARTIARTELARAHVGAAIDSSRQSGVVTGKSSLLASEHDIDDTCDDAEQEGVIPLEDDFQNGEPGPPFHPNCECALEFELDVSDDF